MTADAGQPRRGRPRSEASRRAILEAVRDELAAHGYDRLSIQRVAEAAGVGKQTVYRWWPTKPALVAECVLEGYALAERPVPPNTGDARRDVREWFRAFTKQFATRSNASLLRALSTAAAESEDVAARLGAQLAGPFRAAIVSRIDAARGASGTSAAVPDVLVVDPSSARSCSAFSAASASIPTRWRDSRTCSSQPW